MDHNKEFNRLISFLSLPKSKRKHAKETIDVVAECIRKSGLNVARVAIGGSFGKNTSLRFKFDVDMVAMVHDDDFLHSRPALMIQLEKSLSAIASIQEIEAKGDFCITFRLREVSFDVLLGWNVLLGDEKHKNVARSQRKRLNAVLNKLQDSEAHRALSSSFTESSKGLILAQPQYVRDAIKLGKYWNALFYIFIANDWKSVRILSYAIELIIIHLAKIKGKQQPAQLFRDMLNMFVELSLEKKKTIAFDKIYKASRPQSDNPLEVFAPYQCLDVIDWFSHWDIVKGCAKQTLELMDQNTELYNIFVPQIYHIKYNPIFPPLKYFNISVIKGANNGHFVTIESELKSFQTKIIGEILIATCSPALMYLMKKERQKKKEYLENMVKVVQPKILADLFGTSVNHLQDGKPDNLDVEFLVKVGPWFSVEVELKY